MLFHVTVCADLLFLQFQSDNNQLNSDLPEVQVEGYNNTMFCDVYILQYVSHFMLETFY